MAADTTALLTTVICACTHPGMAVYAHTWASRHQEPARPDRETASGDSHVTAQVWERGEECRHTQEEPVLQL